MATGNSSVAGSWDAPTQDRPRGRVTGGHGNPGHGCALGEQIRMQGDLGSQGISSRTTTPEEGSPRSQRPRSGVGGANGKGVFLRLWLGLGQGPWVEGVWDAACSMRPRARTLPPTSTGAFEQAHGTRRLQQGPRAPDRKQPSKSKREPSVSILDLVWAEPFTLSAGHRGVRFGRVVPSLCWVSSCQLTSIGLVSRLSVRYFFYAKRL